MSESENRKYLAFITIPLFLGLIIYIGFRVPTIKLFYFFEQKDLYVWVNQLRHEIYFLTEYLPDWVIFSLPDGLWLFSCISLILFIWKNNEKLGSVWALIALSLSISSEFLQHGKIIKGTYDSIDILFYFLGFFTSIFLLILKTKRNDAT